MRIKLFFLSAFLLFCNISFAEGQDGLDSILSFGHSVMVITNVLLYTLIVGIIIKFFFLKGNLKNEYIKSFLISLLISLLLLAIFKDEFTFLIYNCL